jgi:hypothetical protein
VRGILADHNIEGHFRALIAIWESEPWREVWAALGFSVESFGSLGIPLDASDAQLWHTCQARGAVLLTANRNDDAPDSLEATIRRFNSETSLPVFTLANPVRFAQDRSYALEVAERLLEYLLDLDDHVGAGRIYV